MATTVGPRSAIRVKSSRSAEKRQLPQLARVAIGGEDRVLARNLLQPEHGRKYLSQRCVAGREKLCRPRGRAYATKRRLNASDNGIDRLVGTDSRS